MFGERTVLFGVLAGRGPGGVTCNPLESFAHLAGNENFYLRFVPHQLTDDLRQVGVAKCSELLRAMEGMQLTHFYHIITGDGSWSYLEYQHVSQWQASRDEMFQRVDPAIGTAKFTLRSERFLHVHHRLQGNLDMSKSKRWENQLSQWKMDSGVSNN
jgi:hypothetical protein